MTQIRILQGDVMKGLAILPDESVQCVVTSPPYWGLRDYGVEGQIGLEKTPEEYVEKMVQVFREVRRVLRKGGTVWLNMGDCYGGSGKGPSESLNKANPHSHEAAMVAPSSDLSGWNLKPKDLIGMPWRLVLALQADGWWLRSDIIWSKPNPMPESVRDRPTKSHEYLFLLAKDSRYFYDADAIREEPKTTEKASWNGYGGQSWHDHADDLSGGQSQPKPNMAQVTHPAGRNRRTVWEIPTQPTPEAHFATFPEALVEPCIKAGTSERGCCPKCGAPWQRVVEKGEPDEVHKKACGADSQGKYEGVSHKQDLLGKQTYTRFNARYKAAQIQNASDVKRRILNGMRERISTWEPDCQCNAGDPVPCVVLDPFAGSGTVAKVARDLGRASISIELSPVYVEIMRRRLRLDEQLFEMGADLK